ncbi:MAG TPA: hypothetical protein VFB45_19920 [Pseudolabrys sp.]|nr:hypothetical protein [Pseudolabrys sp.]
MNRVPTFLLAGALSVAGIGAASAQTVIVDETYGAAPVYDAVPAPVYAAPIVVAPAPRVYAAPAPVYAAPAVPVAPRPEIVVSEPAPAPVVAPAPGVVYTDY